jgi:hypothetical protein
MPDTQSTGLLINLHPLVIMNISDHNTRTTVMNTPGPVIGCLLGILTGRIVNLYNSYELPLIDNLKVDMDYFTIKQEQCYYL